MGYAFIANVLMNSMAHRMGSRAFRIEGQNQILLKSHTKSKSICFFPPNFNSPKEGEQHSFASAASPNSDKIAYTSSGFVDNVKSSDFENKFTFMTKSIFSKVEVALFNNSTAKSNMFAKESMPKNCTQFNGNFYSESEPTEKLHSNLNKNEEANQNAKLTPQLSLKIELLDKGIIEIEPKFKLVNTTIEAQNNLSQQSKRTERDMQDASIGDLSANHKINFAITIEDCLNCTANDRNLTTK